MKVLLQSPEELDLPHWDTFIARSVQRTVYAHSWYLEAVGLAWRALVQYTPAGQIAAALPFQLTKKWGLYKVEQDAFTNELGFYCLPQYPNPEPILRRFQQLPFASRYTFNSQNSPVLPLVNQQTTYHLPLRMPYATLQANYSAHHRRNLAKALAEALSVQQADDLEPLIRLFQENVADRIYGLQPWQYGVLRRLYTELSDRGLAQLWGAYTPAQELVSAALVVKSYERYIYFFAASSARGRALNSQLILLDTLIQQWAGSSTILDFEGGQEPGLARFYSGFGAQAVPLPIYRKMPLEGLRRLLFRFK